MQQQGKIVKWFDDKGFGFIAQDGTNEQIFVHISVFEKGQLRPNIGEVVSYEVANDIKKGLQAYKVKYANRPSTQSRYSEKAYKLNNRVNLFKWICIVALLLISPYLYKKVSFPKWQETQEQQGLKESQPAQHKQVVPISNNQSFQCAGKTRCTEMSSCEEAKFYLNNCPGTIADGDGDGIPCEDQWCGH
ncbi:MAG: cold shock domain-containing protein [Methylophilaceae bacterium]